MSAERSASPRRAIAGAHDGSTPPAAGALVLAALLVSVAARIAFGLGPSMWAWGFTPHAFLPAALGLLPTLALALLLVPALGEALARPPERLAPPPPWLAALACGAAVLLLDDRLWFVGDFVMRQGSPGSDVISAGSFFQAMPLDVFLHRALPEWLALDSPDRAGPYSRALGALNAAALAWIAARTARALALRGAAAWCFVTGAIGGGYATIFTGLGKASGEMCVLVAIAAYAALRVAREWRGHVTLGLAVALALFVHRSGVVLLPLAAVAWVRGWRAHAGERANRRWLAGPALASAALALAGARIARLVATFDVAHHLGPAWSTAGAPSPAFERLVHAADVANIVFALAPWAIVAAALAFAPRDASGGAADDDGARAVFGTLAAACAPIFVFVMPQQGVFRDWDVFAFAGVALALLSAYALARAIERGAVPRRLAPALIAAALVPALQWLALNHSTAAGLARVRAYVNGPPARPAATQAMTWDFLATHSFRIGDWPRAADAAARAAALAPHPRLLILWGLAALRVGDVESSHRAFGLLTERAPDQPIGWLGLAGQSARLRIRDDFERAIAMLRSYPPRSAQARLVRGFVGRYPYVVPDSLFARRPAAAR